MRTVSLVVHCVCVCLCMCVGLTVCLVPITRGGLTGAVRSLGRSREQEPPNHRGVRGLGVSAAGDVVDALASTSTTSDGHFDVDVDVNVDVDVDVDVNVCHILAQGGKTWDHLQPMVRFVAKPPLSQLPLSVVEARQRQRQRQHPKLNVVDVGCDHGVLSFALASTGRYGKIIGTDTSEFALRVGAMENHKRWMSMTASTVTATTTATATSTRTQLDFRHGNGLEPITANDQVDVVCISGVGINTMKHILLEPTTATTAMATTTSTSREEEEEEEELPVDRVGCRRLVLQSRRNPRPRDLLSLYQELQRHGWTVVAEDIAELSSRWYVTTAFDRSTTETTTTTTTCSSSFLFLEPGQWLLESESKSASATASTTNQEETLYLYHRFQKWFQKNL